MNTENEDGLFTCPVICWIIGAILAVVTYLILSNWLGIIISLILALGVLVAAGILLGRSFCSEEAPEQSHRTSDKQDTTAKASAASGLASDTTAAANDKPKPKAAAKPASKAAAKTTKKKPAAKATTKPASKPAAKDGKPKMLTKARAGGADNLKQIKGVGPKLEKSLNEMGVYHFDQVADWNAKEVAWADENLVGFKGRVSRDGWVEQAKTLAKGGETAFSKKVEKGGVYNKK